MSKDLPYEFDAAQIIEQGRTSQGAIDDIRFWLSTTQIPDLPNELIALFLLSCKNNIKATQNTIRNYFRIKKDAPEMFDDRDVDRPELQKVMQTIFAISLPKRMDQNTVVHMFGLLDTNYRNFELIPAMKIAYMIIDITHRRNPPDDLVVIIDTKGVGLMHLTRFKLGAIRKFLEFLQGAMPLRIKQIHILNANYIFDKALAMARAFIRSELLTVLHTHPVGTPLETFHADWVPSKYLPKEYQGELASIDELNQNTVVQFRELVPFFEAEERLRKEND